jgi:Tat pathway signal sequence domain protein
MEEKKGMSRRSFLKTAAAVGAALTIQPAIDKVKAANVAFNGENALSTEKGGMPHRTLGTGRACPLLASA